MKIVKQTLSILLGFLR